MKLLTLKFFLVFIYLISSSISYAIQQPSYKNLLVHKEPIKLNKIAFYNIKNEIVDLNKYKNSLILINFWATWCKPCREEMPSLNRLKTNNNFKNLVILPINVGREDISKLKLFFNELNINNLEILFDNTNNLANNFSLIGLPTTILINKNGEEFARILGPINFDDKKFIEWFKNFD